MAWGTRKKVRRNATRQIARIKAENTRCVVFAESNDFYGQPVDPGWAWRMFERDSDAELWHDPDHPRGDRYLIYFDLKTWCEFPVTG